MGFVGVVPIFMSAGAAALPTLLAAVTSVTAILLKPREIVRICRQRPIAAATSTALFIIIIICGGSLWLWLKPVSAVAATDVGIGISSRYDWVAIAQNILNQEKAGKTPTVLDSSSTTHTDIVLGRDYSRCSFGGGAVPMQLVPMWSFQPEPAWFLSAPVVAGNRVFSASVRETPQGLRGAIVCVNAENGQLIWQIKKANDERFHAFFSSPALTRDGKYLIIGEGLHEDTDCKLRCFDAATGDFRWAVDTSLHIESSPAIFGDRVVVGCGAIEEGFDHKAVGDPGHVLAVRISDGQELWRVPVNDPESSPAIDDAGMVYIGSGFNGNAVVAIRSETDEQLRNNHLERIAWRTPTAQPVTSAITLIGDLVIAGAGNSDFVYANPNPQGWVVALERQTGKVRWQKQFPDAVLGAISAKDGKLICPMRTGEVAALDLADGHTLWKTAISGNAPILAGCAFTGKWVYAVSSDGYLAVLDAASGAVLEKVYINDQKTPGSNKSLSTPQVVGGRVIVGSETGGLRCYIGTRSGE